MGGEGVWVGVGGILKTLVFILGRGGDVGSRKSWGSNNIAQIAWQSSEEDDDEDDDDDDDGDDGNYDGDGDDVDPGE